MQLGIHLPHAGEQATPDKIRRAAMRAEDLGLDDVWVSEHIIVPRATFPRSPLFYDPVLSLVWAAAVTKRVRLGTSVLVLPMRHPLSLAKELATLQNFSEGRLILGAGVGWLEAEFAALGAPFHERGRRTDEGIAMMQPLPVKPIPIWFGARSEAAYRRTVRIGDGWHGSQLTPEQALPAINRLRRERPEPEFTISMRTHWNGKDQGELRERIAAYGAVGVQHVMVHPLNRDIDDWDEVIEGAGRLVGRI
jgi:alkanesulfonate monooxygenase SsuD/methylene tetrahydromethanopterin reductase-like flavin-dependent oxidoreductase (luciferase family)